MSYSPGINPEWKSSRLDALPPPPSLTPSRPAPPVPIQRSTSSSHPIPSQSSNASSPYSSSTYLPSQASSAFAVSGAGAGSAQTIVKRGWVSVKEDGLRAWIWSKRWLILREQTLSFYKNEVRRVGFPARTA